MIIKYIKPYAIAFATLAVASTLFLGLHIHTSTPAHARALATNLTVTYIAVDDQNWNAKKAYTQGDQARFVVYVHNPSNFPDAATIYESVVSGGGFTILNTTWSVVIPGNSTPGYAWILTVPNNAPAGIYYYHPSVRDNQGTVDSWAVITVRNHIGYNPYPSSQCTWKAEDQMHSATGIYMPNFGDAHSWRDNAGPNGWSVGTTPETSSVMVMQYADSSGHPYKYWFWNNSQWVQTYISTFGHVGWVTSIGSGGAEVYIVDRNWNLDGQDGGRWIWISGAPVNFIYSAH